MLSWPRSVPLLLGLALGASACKKEEPPRYAQPTGMAPTGPAPQYPPPTGAPMPAPAPAPTPPVAPPAPTPAGPAPAAGLPCASDMDLVCPFGRCRGGRCGGCQTASDCKAGAACLNTPVGLACMPAAPPAPAPAPTPAPSPAPAPTPSATPPPAPAADTFAAARERCLQKTNEYRASKGLGPLTRRPEREACTDGQAQADAMSSSPHGSFGKCGELAQNECPGWKGTPESIVDTCLKAMFDEGPGQGPSHGHYNNLMSSSYGRLACGFFVAADGSVWMVQNFMQ